MGESVLYLAVAVAPNHKSETMMAKRAGWMIIGANGFTGHLVARMRGGGA